MNARTLPRVAIESYLTAVRIPIDAAIDRLPGNGTGVGPTVRVMVDRADASLRAVVASVLGDRSLQADADQRAQAADKREQALRLREQAEQTAEKADDRLQQREAQAERRRVEAEKKAKTQREQAERERAQKTEKAAEVERKRKQSSQRAKAQSTEKITERARKERLEALEAKTDSLAAKEQALTAADEAKRLRDAAAATKAERKAAAQRQRPLDRLSATAGAIPLASAGPLGSGRQRSGPAHREPPGRVDIQDGTRRA